MDLADDNQNEVFIAVYPSTSGRRAFVFSNQAPFTSEGMFGAYTDEFGKPGCWTPRAVGREPPEPTPAEIPPAVGDPWAVFTDQGTLFIAYLHDRFATDPDFPITGRPTIVAVSDDSGANFDFVEVLGSVNTDRPSMATGPGPTNDTLWVLYEDQFDGNLVVEGTELAASGMPVDTDSGNLSAGVFTQLSVIASPASEFNPGHIAVGPNGEVLATLLRPGPSMDGPVDIFALLDNDGLGATGSFPGPLCDFGETENCVQPMYQTGCGLYAGHTTP